MADEAQPSSSEAPREATLESVQREIARVLRSELQLAREPKPEDDLALDLQLDSVSMLTLVVELENAFRVALKEEDAAEVRTVNDLAALVVARTRESRATAPGAALPSTEGPP